MIVGNSIDSTGLPTFTESTGVTVDTINFTPVDYFKLLWTDTLTEEILKQSNFYGQQHLQENNDYLESHPKSRAHIFRRKNFTLCEMFNFLAIVIAMGITNLPALSDYWKTSWPFCNTSFSKVMSRDQFLVIMKFLYLADNSHYIPYGCPNHDKIYKIRPLITHLLARFKSSYTSS